MCRNKIDSFIHLKFWIAERMKARDYLNLVVSLGGNNIDR